MMILMIVLVILVISDRTSDVKKTGTCGKNSGGEEGMRSFQCFSFHMRVL